MHAHYGGHGEGEQSEHSEAPLVAPYALDVHLERGKKHDIVESYLAKQLERVVAHQYVQAVLTHGNTCQHHSDDMRNAQLAHHYRGKQNDEHHHEEDERGVGYGKTTGYIGHVGLSLGFTSWGAWVIITLAKLLKIRLKHS